MLIQPPPLQPTRILAGCIAVWDEVWENPTGTIQAIEDVVANPTLSIKWDRAMVYSTDTNMPIESTKRTNSHMNLNSAGHLSEELRQINNNYYLLLLAATEWYREYFGIVEGLYFTDSFSILKYQTAQEYKSHYDGGSITKRVISPILYLNDDYEGGWLEFTNFNIVEKPKAGSLYIFPSNFAYRHIAHPVTEGTKYGIVTFISDQA